MTRLLTALLFPALLIAAEETPAPVRIPAAKAPVLDGHLDEAEWKDAAVLESKILRVRILRDDQSLYLALETPSACDSQEEIYLLLGSAPAASPSAADLQLAFAPLNLQRQPWTESIGDGKAWVPAAAPAGWTARASYEKMDRLQAEFAISLARLPSRTALRLGLLVSVGRGLALPETANLYAPDSWTVLDLGADLPAGDAKAFDEARKVPETVNNARLAREAATAARARHEEVAKREGPPKTQAERTALGQALEAAERSYAKACALEPANPILHYDRGSLLYMKGDMGAALAELEEACRLAPHVPRFDQRLYGACKSANRFRRCLEIGEAEVAARPEAWDGYFLRGQARLMVQDFDGARKDLEKTSTYNLGARMGQTLDRLLETVTAFQKAWAEETQAQKRDAAKGDLPRAEIQTARGRIVVELFEDDAPEATAWFVQLAEAKAFDGQGYLALRAAGSQPDGPETKRHHWRGSLSLFPPGPQGGGPQFVLTPSALPEYDGHCSVFGRVLEGMEFAEALRPGEPLKSVRILSKRDHPYAPKGPPQQEPPQPPCPPPQGPPQP